MSATDQPYRMNLVSRVLPWLLAIPYGLWQAVAGIVTGKSYEQRRAERSS